MRSPLAYAISAALLLPALNAQDPLKTLPNNYRLLFDNPMVRVIRVTYHARQKLPVHDHPATPTIYVYLSDCGPVRFSHVEDEPFALNRPPVKAGSFRVSPGRIEKHSVENLGDQTSEFLRVELKQLALGFQKNSFRGAKHFDLTQSGVTTEYSNSALGIERIVSINHQPPVLPDPDRPSLLVLFSSGHEKGEVRWVDPGQRLALETGDTLHILRIVFR